jgi:hypothetical protein
LVEANPDNYEQLLEKNRKSWSVGHCLSMNPTPEVVYFDAATIFGGIIQDGRPKPGDSLPSTDRENQRKYMEPTRRTIKVSFNVCFYDSSGMGMQSCPAPSDPVCLPFVELCTAVYGFCATLCGVVRRSAALCDVVRRRIVQLCAALCSLVQLCAALCSFVQLCTALCSFVQLCAALCSFVQLCTALCSFVQPRPPRLSFGLNFHFLLFSDAMFPIVFITFGSWQPNRGLSKS